MKIKALVPFSNGTLSMEQYQVAEVTDTLGNQLIAAGVAIEIGGGGTGGGVLVVTVTEDGQTLTSTLNKTWQEIHDAMLVGSVVVQNANDETEVCGILRVIYDARNGGYAVRDGYGNNYLASSASDYPSMQL